MLDVAARALATQIAAAAPLAVAQTKATLAAAIDRELESALDREAAAQAIDFGTADLARGAAGGGRTGARRGFTEPDSARPARGGRQRHQTATSGPCVV